MQKTLIALAIAGLASPLYAQIQGKVLDEAGFPISQASVEVVGSQTRVQTNEQGEFSLPASKMPEVELHIKARDYIHKTFHVRQRSQQDFILSSSAIEVVNITGLPMHQSNLESSQPVNVISVDELRDQQSSSLGEALKNEPGIHSSYYSSNSASPIIRGLDGSRVLIAQNGLDAGDASRVGPDHAVSAETSYAQQIEVLRGPATLFYGSGAIGGVVNVVDDRIPKGTDTYGEWRLENHSVADDKLISASGNTGISNFGLHADAFWRDADNYKIPGTAESHHDHHEEEAADENRLLNSWTEAAGGNLGASYIDDEGYIGISLGQLNRQYGIPGHGHGDEIIDVYADLEQTRWQLQGKRNLDSAWLSSTAFSAGYTDYQHAEIEDNHVGTTFKNKTAEVRWELFHQAIDDWRGAISLHYKHSDFEASGEEAFTPPNKTETIAFSIIEEKHIDSLLLQLGLRVEQVNITSNNFAADLNQPDADPEDFRVFSVDHQSTPFSLSAGAVWDFTQGYNAAISLTQHQNYCRLGRI
jgi:iron complex outermembrane receptor protein